MSVQPVDPPRVLRRTHIPTPAVVGMRADTMNYDYAAGEASMKPSFARADVPDDISCVCWRVAEHFALRVARDLPWSCVHV
jgi:hypothetical protein